LLKVYRINESLRLKRLTKTRTKGTLCDACGGKTAANQTPYIIEEHIICKKCFIKINTEVAERYNMPKTILVGEKETKIA
jgi:hypothetical protein